MCISRFDPDGPRAQAKGITGILNGVEDIVRPDNEDLGLEVLYNASSLEKKLEVKAKAQVAHVRPPYPPPAPPRSPPPPLPFSFISAPLALQFHQPLLHFSQHVQASSRRSPQFERPGEL